MKTDRKVNKYVKQSRTEVHWPLRVLVQCEGRSPEATA